MTRRKVMLLGLLVLVIAVVGVILLSVNNPKSRDQFTFTNLSSCTKSINSTLVHNMDTSMYTYIKMANDYIEAPTAAHYDGTIREGSCVTKQNTSTAKTTVAVVDIPAAKQSWKITFGWVSGPLPQDDIPAPNLSCLPTDQLPYGDFGCTQVLNLQKYGTDEYDPILQYTPYTSSEFNIAYTPDKNEVDVTILVRPQDVNNTELINNDKEAIGLWFTQHHLNISDYTVQYTVSQVAE